MKQNHEFSALAAEKISMQLNDLQRENQGMLVGKTFDEYIFLNKIDSLLKQGKLAFEGDESELLDILTLLGNAFSKPEY